VLDTLRTGKWYRGAGKMVDQFQKAYADLYRREILPGPRERHQRFTHQP
jgi:hypothetical protein